ncbi:MAG: 2-hydroxyacid dehydrogenase [Candidatus Hydrogenedentota bacterium]
MARVFVTRTIPQEGLDQLRNALGENEVAVFPHDRIINRAELLEDVRGVEAILSILTDPIDAEVMDAAGPRLRVIANYAVGFNNIDVEAASSRGIAVTNTPGVLTETTADIAWALLMTAARRIAESERYLRAGKWEGWGPQQFLGVDVHGATLGIYGMGRIGQAVARRGKGFGMRVLYTSRNPIEPDVEAELGAERVDKDTLLAESDFLSIHCPLTDETRGAFGAAEFKTMKSSAVLINTSRGPVVDEGALAQALQRGDLFGAGLDVFEKEPKVHPDILQCENAVLIPHLGSASFATRRRMAEMTAENILAVLNGETPPNCVNPEAL